MSCVNKAEKVGSHSLMFDFQETGHSNNKTQLIFVLLFLWALLIHPSIVHSRSLSVGTDYPTIEDALKNARDGDLITVRGGVYKNRLKIRKSIHLKGFDNPVIMVPNGRIIEVTSPRVIIEGFTLTYDTSDLAPSDTAIYISKGADETIIRNNRLLNVMFGIWNIEGRDIRIENNIIVGLKKLNRNARGNGINVTGSQRLHVVNNQLNYCRDGIYMELSHDATIVGNEIKNSRYSVHTMWVDRGVFNKNTVYDNLVGLAIMYTKHAKINENFSYANSTSGLILIQAVRSEIKSNTLLGNTKGIFLYGSLYNELSSNLVMNNQLGIHSWGGSEDNRIFGNSFISNEIQVKHVAGRDQQWNNNYWSDYIGWDTAGDGIGDYAYESNSVVDHILWKYPLAKVLYTSPSLRLLWMIEKQFPLFKVSKIVDHKPTMAPFHNNWKELRELYPSDPQRFYGEIEKLSHIPGDK
jgi:nitrous oxidase accessory protein